MYIYLHQYGGPYLYIGRILPYHLITCTVRRSKTGTDLKNSRSLVEALTESAVGSMSAENDALSANEGDTVDNVREQVLKGKLDQVQQEKAFLLDSLNRTEAQLRRVLKQQEACAPVAALSEQQEQELRAQNDAPRPPWLESQTEMSPLLAAYDGRVAELETELARMKEELLHANEQAQSLITENENLHSDLKHTLQKLVDQAEAQPLRQLGGSGTAMGGLGIRGAADSSEGAQGGGGAGGESNSGSMGLSIAAAEEIEELHQRVELLGQEAALLTKQSETRRQERDEARLSMERCTKQLEATTARLREVQEALGREVEARRSLAAECEACKRVAETSSAQIETLTASQRQLEQNLSKAAAESRALTAKLQHSEQQGAEHLQRAQAESARLQDQVRYHIERSRAHANDVDIKSRALEQATENNRKVERELRETKADAKGMLSVIELNEKQLGFYATREENQKKMAIEADERVAKAQVQAAQSDAHATAARKEVETLLARVASLEAAQVEAEEAAATAARARLQSVLEQRVEEIGDLRAEMAKQAETHARELRDKEDAVTELESLRQAMTDQSAHIEGLFDSLRGRASKAEEDCACQRARAEALEARNEERRVREERRAREADLQRETLSTRLAEQEREVDAMQERVRTLTGQRELSEREAARARNELQKAKDMAESLRVQTANEGAAEIKRVRSEAIAAHARVRQLESERASMEQAARDSVERAERAADERAHAAEQAAAEAKQEQSAQTARARELASNLTSTMQQLVERESELLEQEEQRRQLTQLVGDAEQHANELSAQLAEALSKQQQMGDEQRELRGTVDRLRMREGRAEREHAELSAQLADARQRMQQHGVLAFSAPTTAIAGTAAPVEDVGGSGAGGTVRALLASSWDRATGAERASRRQQRAADLSAVPAGSDDGDIIAHA